MILVDVNLLLYAQFASYAEHEVARQWLEQRFNSGRVGLPWSVLLGFARIASNPRIFSDAPPVDEVWQVVEAWLALDTVWSPAPGAGHASLVAQMLEAVPVRRLVTDAHLAALAVEHGLVLCSADTDFARFPMVRWDNPLVGRER